jgi:hypothetical protein
MSRHEHHSQQSFSVSGTGHRVQNRIGTLNQTVYHHAGQMPVEEVYRIKKAWTTRLTSWHFGLISAVASVLALIPAYMTFEPLVQAVSDNRGLDQAPAPTVVGLVTFIGFLLLAAVALGLRRVTRHRLLCLSRWSWLPAIATMDGRFALVRLAGDCSRCHSRLRFRSRPERWISTTGPLGIPTKKVTERRPVAECVANNAHAWALDPAEDRPGR